MYGLSCQQLSQERPRGVRPIYSVSGTWIAFETPEHLIWRPDGSLLGHRVSDDVFTLEGTYLGSVVSSIFTWMEERAKLRIPRAEAPIAFPGYPGLPDPSFIRPLQPGETLEAKLVFG